MNEENEVSEEFEIYELRNDMHPHYVMAIAEHKPCGDTVWFELVVGVEFECEECKRRFRIESIFPFKIVEVKKH